jgi:hypothetical protein
MVRLLDGISAPTSLHSVHTSRGRTILNMGSSPTLIRSTPTTVIIRPYKKGQPEVWLTLYDERLILNLLASL